MKKIRWGFINNGKATLKRNDSNEIIGIEYDIHENEAFSRLFIPYGKVEGLNRTNLIFSKAEPKGIKLDKMKNKIVEDFNRLIKET